MVTSDKQETTPLNLQGEYESTHQAPISNTDNLARHKFRTDQIRILQQQVKTELLASIVIAAIISTIFWQLTPPNLMLGWTMTIILSVGVRSLFITGMKMESTSDQSRIWGGEYVFGSVVSGTCWGALGIIAAVYGEQSHQIFVMFVLAGAALTAYISMQSSPGTVAAFVVPALAPITAWFFYQGNAIDLALGATSIIYTALIITSAWTMRTILAKSYSIGANNTELIRKLVIARESAERAKNHAEKSSEKLHKEVMERELAQERIHASEQRMSAIFENIQDTIYQIDIHGRILWATPSIERLLGYRLKEITNASVTTLYASPEKHVDFINTLESNYGRLQHFEKQLQHKDGTKVWVAENAHYKYNENGEITGVEGTMRDITMLKHTKKELHKEKERAHITLCSIGDGVITTDTQGHVDYMNSVAEQGTGWNLDEARGKPIMKVLKIIDESSLKTPPSPVELCLNQGRSAIIAGHLLLIHRYSNKRMSIEVNASPIMDSNKEIIGTVLVFHDVTELRGLAKKMSYQATHDSLTGLINRREFEHRINQALEVACSEGTRHTLCYMDLDNFKVVNDTCGHTAGDELLKQLTVRLRMELREADTLARLGGDEFGILLEGCSIESAHEPAEQLRRIVDEFRFLWNDKPFRVGASIGLVAITADSGSMTDVMSAADSACYVAKENGRNRTHIFEANDKAIVERSGQMQWVHRIQNVLEENRFRLFFQPIVNLKPASGEENRIHGEVLIRMLDDNNDLVGSGAFIPSAERYGLMPAIDRWVIENTFNMLCLDIQKISQRMSACCINLSGQSLSDDRFMDFLVNQIEDSGISPGLLCFEITETAVIANLSQASRMISMLREMGCRFALDDFGVGLSSFSYLKNLSVDYLKLDGCFVQNMIKDNIDLAMVKAINQIGHTMNIKTIAEFVEDRATLCAVRDIGVDYAQGYAIARPAPMEIGLFGDPVKVDLSDSDADIPVRLKAISGEAG